MLSVSTFFSNPVPAPPSAVNFAGEMDKLGGGYEPILSDRVLVDGTLTPLSFYFGGDLRWSVANGRRKHLSLEKEVLSVSVEGSRIVLKCAIADGGVSDSGGGVCRLFCLQSNAYPARKSFVFEPCSEDSLRAWYLKLKDYIDALGRPRRLFLLVNPFGGQNTAANIFEATVIPLLEDADIQFTMQETKHQLHAKELAYELDLTKYDGIVCVSGDGILVEVINGLLERKDWITAIKMPIGVVPAGTGNGMAKSLLDSAGDPCSAFNAVLAIIRGHTQPLDVATILQGNTRYFSVLMLAWGLIADIDIESEKYRWMGRARLDFYAIQRILRLRRYRGRIYFVPAPGFEEQVSQRAESISQLQLCSTIEEESNAARRGYLGPDVDVDSTSWRCIEGPFISVWIHNVPWGSEDTKAAPHAQFSDGYLDLVLIRDAPKLALLGSLTELSSGKHINSPHVLYIKAKAFIVEPGPQAEDSSKGGIIDCDGEVLARGNGVYESEKEGIMTYDKLQITVDQGLATLFCPVK